MTQIPSKSKQLNFLIFSFLIWEFHQLQKSNTKNSPLPTRTARKIDNFIFIFINKFFQIFDKQEFYLCFFTKPIGINEGMAGLGGGSFLTRPQFSIEIVVLRFKSKIRIYIYRFLVLKDVEKSLIKTFNPNL